MSTARPGGLPRPLVWLAVALAAILLTGFFVVLGFPYDALGRSLSEQARASGIAVDVRGLSPALTIAGPGVRADTVVLGSGAERVQLSDVHLRPAWSLSWLQGAPAVHVRLASEVGNADGTVTLGARQGFTGTLEQVRLEALPIGRLGPGVSATGLLDAEPDLLLVPGEDGAPPTPEGELRFRVANGSVGLPNLPIGLPFQQLAGELRFGEEDFATVDRLQLEGPMVAGTAKGRIEASDQGWYGPLDLQVDLTAQDPMTRNLLQQSRVRMDRQGRATLSIQGSLRSPVVRGAGAGAVPDPFQ